MDFPKQSPWATHQGGGAKSKGSTAVVSAAVPASSQKYSLKQLRECGRSVLAFEGRVFDVGGWLDSHPGGSLAIEHMVGKDATDQIRAFHPAYVWESMLGRFCVGELVLSEEEVLAGESNALLSVSFNALKQRLEDEGLFEPDTSFYNILALRYLAQFAAAVVLTLFLPSPLNALVGGAAVAAFWQQLAFFAHDAGHSGVTQDRTLDSMLGTVAASALGGLSLSWWKSTHNVHHLETNHPEHDPDIQHMPLLAVSKRNCEGDGLYSTYHRRAMPFDAAAKLALLLQPWTYLPLLALGRINLYLQSYTFLFANYHQLSHGGIELTGLVVFWLWYAALCRSLSTRSDVAIFVVASHCLSAVLHVQINMSHWGMSTEEPAGGDEHFAAKALRTTMDVDCPEWLDWFHGGLQFQAVHHLFPRLPRRNLRSCVPLVQEFATANGLVYQRHGFFRGNGMVFDSLRTVAAHTWSLLLSKSPAP